MENPYEFKRKFYNVCGVIIIFSLLLIMFTYVFAYSDEAWALPIMGDNFITGPVLFEMQEAIFDVPPYEGINYQKVENVYFSGEALKILNDLWLDSYVNETERAACISAEFVNGQVIISSEDQIHFPKVINATKTSIRHEGCYTNIRLHTHPYGDGSPSGADMRALKIDPYADISCIVYYINSINCFYSDYVEFPVRGDLTNNINLLDSED